LTEEVLVDSNILQIKRGSSSYWLSENPTLADGEPGYVTDTNKLKIGDGKTFWNLLPYVNQPIDNYIINGGFDIWQRGSVFNSPFVVTPAELSFLNATVYPGDFCADRWRLDYKEEDFTPITITKERLDVESFHQLGPSTESGYEGQNYLRFFVFGVYEENPITDRILIRQPIEDVTTFSNQHVTMSFYARADVDSDIENNQNRNIKISMEQNFGATRYGTVLGEGGTLYDPPTSSPIETQRVEFELTTTWKRYVATFFLPSIDTAIINDYNTTYINATIFFPQENFDTSYQIDIWGVQVEASDSPSLSFKRNSNTLAQELAACQRYFSKSLDKKESIEVSDLTKTYNTKVGSIYMKANGAGDIFTVYFPVQMRAAPSSETTYRGGASRLQNRFKVYPSKQLSNTGQSLITPNEPETGFVYDISGNKFLLVQAYNAGDKNYSFQLREDPSSPNSQIGFFWIADAELY